MGVVDERKGGVYGRSGIIALESGSSGCKMVQFPWLRLSNGK